jgi:hypothetical protein
MERLEAGHIFRNQQVAGSFRRVAPFFHKLTSCLQFQTCSNPVRIDWPVSPINSDSRATAAARTLAGIDV